MTYLLDSNAVIAVLRGDPAVLARLRTHRPQDFGISAVVEHELSYGAYKGQRVAENLQRLDALRFAVVEFDREDARCAGQIRAALAASGRPIGPYDVLIAGQAIARRLILVTRNTREFKRIPSLQVENWEG